MIVSSAESFLQASLSEEGRRSIFFSLASGAPMVLGSTDTGSGGVIFFLTPSIPAAIITARAKYGLQLLSIHLISMLVDSSSRSQYSDGTLTAASRFSYPQQVYAELHDLGFKRL